MTSTDDGQSEHCAHSGYNGYVAMWEQWACVDQLYIVVARLALRHPAPVGSGGGTTRKLRKRGEVPLSSIVLQVFFISQALPHRRDNRVG